MTNNANYADPYRGVVVNVVYTKPDASTVAFWGFYDEANTWRIRFMPDQLGLWSYHASFSDGVPAASGTFECVPGDIPGLISHDEVNPLWFGFKGGRHVLLRSFQVGDRFFASNWPATDRTAFLDWAQGQGYNMLAIASHYLNRDSSERGQGWTTPDLWDGATRSLKASEYRKMEAILDDLAARKILVYPFAGFYGKASDFPTNRADQTKTYLRYMLARLVPYWNVIFNIAGPEPLLPGDEWQYQNAMGSNDLSRLGNLIKSLDPLGHPLSVHNVTDQNAFAHEPWESYTTLQGPKTLSRQELSSGLLTFHGSKPLYALEVLWPGNALGHPEYSDTDIRKNAFVILMSAATLNFGDMNGNSSSGFSGTMDLADRIQSRHDIIKKVWDFFETKRFWLMQPHQELVSNGYCLAKPGHEYLVYLESPGSVSITLSNGPFQVEWINAQNTFDSRPAAPTTNGFALTSPAGGDDWILHLTKPIEAWRAKFFPNQLDLPALSGDLADPDGDGVRNEDEFLYALNPIVPDADLGHLPCLIRQGGMLQLRYVRRMMIWPKSWALEFSPWLGSWTAGTPGEDYQTVSSSLNGNGTETVTVTVPPNKNSQFVRVVAK